MAVAAGGGEGGQVPVRQQWSEQRCSTICWRVRLRATGHPPLGCRCCTESAVCPLQPPQYTLSEILGPPSSFLCRSELMRILRSSARSKALPAVAPLPPHPSPALPPHPHIPPSSLAQVRAHAYPTVLRAQRAGGSAPAAGRRRLAVRWRCGAALGPNAGAGGVGGRAGPCGGGGQAAGAGHAARGDRGGEEGARGDMPYETGVARLLEEIRKGSDACCPFWPLPLLAGPREEAFHATLRLSSTSMQALRKKLPMPPSAARSQQSAAQPSAEDSELMSGAEFVNMDEIYKVGSWQRRVQGGGGGGREREGAERRVQEEERICWWERSVCPSSRPPLPPEKKV